MYESRRNYDEPEPDKDIVEELIETDIRNKAHLKDAFTMGPTGSNSLLLRAASEIQRLRRELGKL